MIATNRVRAAVSRDGTISSYGFWVEEAPITVGKTPEEFYDDVVDYRPDQVGGAPASSFLSTQICRAMFKLLAGESVELPLVLDDE